jgi:hypothetical protein
MTIFAPGGETESFIRAAGALAAEEPADMAEVLALASAHNIEITRPLEAVQP